MARFTDKEKDAFFDACETGDIGLVEKTLDAFPHTLNMISGLGQTALFHAAMYAREEIVALLLDKGADTAHRDPHGFTAYEQAGRQNFTSICDQFQTAAVKRERDEQCRAQVALIEATAIALEQYSTGLESPLKLGSPLQLRK